MPRSKWSSVKMYARALVLTALWGACLSALFYGAALAEQGTREVGFGDSAPALSGSVRDGTLRVQVFGRDFSLSLDPAAYSYLTPYAQHAVNALPAPATLVGSGLAAAAREISGLVEVLLGS